jgi:GxxExxY protein
MNSNYLEQEGYDLMKTVKKLTPEHEQQLLNYMHITQKAVGYLINFSTPKSVEWKRYILSEFIPD